MIILLKRGNTSTWSHNKKIRELVHRNFPSIGRNDSITTADPPDPAISGRLSFTRNAPLMARGYMDDVKCGSTRRRCSSKWSMREASIDARCFELSGRAPCTRRKASTKAEHARGQPRLLPSKKEHRATDPRETSDANIPRDAEVGLTLSLFSTSISRKVNSIRQEGTKCCNDKTNKGVGRDRSADSWSKQTCTMEDCWLTVRLFPWKVVRTIVYETYKNPFYVSIERPCAPLRSLPSLREKERERERNEGLEEREGNE